MKLVAPKTGAIKSAANARLDRKVLKIATVSALEMTTVTEVEVIIRVSATSRMMPLDTVAVQATALAALAFWKRSREGRPGDIVGTRPSIMARTPASAADSIWFAVYSIRNSAADVDQTSDG